MKNHSEREVEVQGERKGEDFGSMIGRSMQKREDFRKMLGMSMKKGVEDVDRILKKGVSFGSSMGSSMKKASCECHPNQLH
jgi:hypothetical protein